MLARVESPRLTDHAEAALLAWLSPGRYRSGDRLPPEHDLAKALGVSRGTLRTALARLEARGAIVRRRGSGTFVASLDGLGAGIDAGLEVLESYSELARRQGFKLGVRSMKITSAQPTPKAMEALDLDPEAEVVLVERTVLIDGRPAVRMVDNILPIPALPPAAELRKLLRGGDMILDVLNANGATLGMARTEISSRLITPQDPIGQELDVEQEIAALDLFEILYDELGKPVQHSYSCFAPGRLTVHVLRGLPASSPPPVSDFPSPLEAALEP